VATAFETAQLRDGIAAYRALSSLRGEENASASGALQRLTVRRTLTLQNATYQDLISTGNLRLIRNRELRDRIVDYYEGTRWLYEVINRNNSFFVDDLYNGTVVADGLVMPRSTLGNLSTLVSLDSALLAALRPGYVDEPDRLWSLPHDGREWAAVKSVLLTRIRVSAIARYYDGKSLEETRQLEKAVQAERKEP
jgi:hypothetical protein